MEHGPCIAESERMKLEIQSLTDKLLETAAERDTYKRSAESYKSVLVELSEKFNIPLDLLLPMCDNSALSTSTQQIDPPEEKQGSRNENPMDDNKIFHMVMDYVTEFRDLKNCRLVSRQWNDVAFQRIGKISHPFVRLDSAGDVQNYVDLMATSFSGNGKLPYSRFLLRTTDRSILNPSFLPNFAPSIKCLQIARREVIDHFTPNMDSIKRILEQMINLQELILCSISFRRSYGVDVGAGWNFKISSLKKMEIQADRHKAVAFEHHINLRSVFSIAPTLESVKLSFGLGSSHQTPLIHQLYFSALQHQSVPHLKSLEVEVNSLGNSSGFQDVLNYHKETLEFFSFAGWRFKDEYTPIEMPVLKNLRQLKLSIILCKKHSPFPFRRSINGDEFPVLNSLDITTEALFCDYISSVQPITSVRNLTLTTRFRNKQFDESCLKSISRLNESLPGLVNVSMKSAGEEPLQEIQPLLSGNENLEKFCLEFRDVVLPSESNYDIFGFREPNSIVEAFQFHTMPNIESYVALNVLQKMPADHGLDFRRLKNLKHLEIKAILGHCFDLEAFGYLKLLAIPKLDCLKLDLEVDVDDLQGAKDPFSKSCIQALEKKHKTVIVRLKIAEWL